MKGQTSWEEFWNPRYVIPLPRGKRRSADGDARAKHIHAHPATPEPRARGATQRRSAREGAETVRLGEELEASEQVDATPFGPRTKKDRIEEELFAERRDLDDLQEMRLEAAGRDEKVNGVG